MKSNKNLWRSLVVTGLLMGAAVSAHAQALAQASKIVQPGQQIFGKSYNQLIEKWTNWFVTEPLATHPAFDPDGRFCDRNQEGDVWFLAGSYEGIYDRTCAVPAGKALFVPLGGIFVSFAPEFPVEDDTCLQMGSTVEKLRCDVNNDIPTAPSTRYEVTLDGVAVEDLFAYRTQSLPGGYTLRVPDPSFITDLGLPAGNRFPAVADGYFLLLKPLKTGVHTLTLRTINPDQSVLGVNYTLIIEN